MRLDHDLLADLPESVIDEHVTLNHMISSLSLFERSLDNRPQSK